MERKCKRVQTEKLREAGDSQLKPVKVMERRQPPDRGDAKRIKIIPKPADRLKPTKTINRKPENPPKELVSQATSTPMEKPKADIQVSEKKEDMEYVEYRKRVRDRYTVHARASQKGDGIKKERACQKGEHIKKEQVKDELPKNQSTNEPKQRKEESLEIKSEKSAKNPIIKRKPIIKTITSKNDSVRVFKAVTFMDQKPKKPLQIKMPRQDVRKPKDISKIPKLVNRVRIQLAQSKLSVENPLSVKKQAARKKKPVKGKRETKALPIPSPQASAAIVSPPTEIAKWAACSPEKHMPYYEAWVNTTLAAISKLSKKDKQFLEKQNVLQTFKKQLLERRLSPELIHERFADERYTGKIKVRQR